MANGNRAAVDVDFVGVPFQLFGHRQGLRGKGFVGFDQVQVADAPAGFVQAAAGGRDRADAHDGRVDAGIGVAGDTRQYGQAKGLGLVGAHQQHRGGAVVEAGCVARGDAAVFLERGFEFGQRLGGGAGARLFIHGEGHRVALALRDQNRRDLIGKAAGFDGGGGFLLGRGGEGVLGFTADAVLVHQVLGGDAHVVVVERVPQAVGDHAVDHLGVAHAQAGARGGQDVRRQAHVLHAAGDDYLGIAAADGLGAQVQGLEAGAADLVQGQAWHGVGQAGEDRRLACRVLAAAGSQHLA